MSTDEMTGIQALERIAPTKVMQPGQVERREFEYDRHGTLSLIANFDVVSGQVVSPYQSALALWARYCADAGVTCTMHQLRHTHATELVNAGVSLATIRKRLGHQNVQTTLRYAEQSDTM